MAELDKKTKAMLKLIDEDADSFAQRAEMYCKKRPELISLVEDLYRTHRSLVERYGASFRSMKHISDKAYDSCSDTMDSEDYAESEIDDAESQHKYNMNIINEEVAMKLREEVERLKEDNKKVKAQLLGKDEEKRQVIRELSLAIKVLKDENMELKKLKESPMKWEFSKLKEGIFGMLFSGSLKEYSNIVYGYDLHKIQSEITCGVETSKAFDCTKLLTRIVSESKQGVVCEMLKQVIWNLRKRVVSDSGDKLILPCMYVPTSSFHAGQVHCSQKSFFGVEDFLDDDNSRPYTYQKEKKSKNPNKHVSFKQQTEAYMEPFTLDVFISKRFVSASVTHRVTCKQVAVAGTNSKDIKAVLRSRSDIPACLAIGRILAERAREGDVYTASYTPRERDKFEGKIRAVVQSLIDNGIDIKVYLD
ncbi:hypothetical protein PVK06_027704 [Gossypium arboreum]|uniref:NAB domain-containing protein n=2 Tax=Gossypium arboreum TaxID=29729 RepID=A0ABR0P3M6_GOSAR|nr:hypothetical protein PVK06_027704 [Gossypium arboreum]